MIGMLCNYSVKMMTGSSLLSFYAGGNTLKIVLLNRIIFHEFDNFNANFPSYIIVHTLSKFYTSKCLAIQLLKCYNIRECVDNVLAAYV